MLDADSRGVSAPSPLSPDDEISSLEVVYKISERCNLACDYCYFFFRGDESYKDHPPIAPMAVTSALVDFINDAARRYKVKKINVVLHGGEPLMLPKRRFVELCQQFVDNCETPVNFAMQTNGALVTPAWIELLNRFKVGAGVSFDGPADIHDVHRFDRRGRPSYDNCRRGWDLLVEASQKRGGVAPGLLCVIDPDVDPDRVFDHFVDDLGATQMNFLLPDYNHDDPLPAGYGDRVGDYMISVFDNWVRRKNKDISIRFIKETFFTLSRPDSLRAIKIRAHDTRNQMSISSNGEINLEDTIKILPGYQSSEMTVFNSTLQDVFSSRSWLELGASLYDLAEPCQTCDWRKICNGGRSHNRFSKQNGFKNPSIFCSGLQKYYEHITASLVKCGRDLDDIHSALVA